MTNELNPLPSLEVPCKHCRGTGAISDGGVTEPCTACDGAGHVPTAMGKRVLALMRHNFQPMLSAALRRQP